MSDVIALVAALAQLVQENKDYADNYGVFVVEMLGTIMRELSYQTWDILKGMTATSISFTDRRITDVQDDVEAVGKKVDNANTILSTVIYPKIASIGDKVDSVYDTIKTLPEEIASLPDKLAAQWAVLYNDLATRIGNSMASAFHTLSSTIADESEKTRRQIQLSNDTLVHSISSIDETLYSELERLREDTKDAITQSGDAVSMAIAKYNKDTQERVDRMQETFEELTDASIDFYMNFWENGKKMLTELFTWTEDDMRQSFVSLFEAQKRAMAEIQKIVGGSP